MSVLFLAATLLTYYAFNRLILHSFFGSGDEHSSYFLADCIRQGKLWATPHPLPDFFEVVHIGNKAGKWFSVYPPGWPAIWAIGLKLNITNWLNPLLASISFVFFYRAVKKLFGFVPAYLGLVLMCFTPFFIFNHAAYFSHSTAMLTISIFLFTYLKWFETRSPAWSVLCAFAIGYGLGTRYLTIAGLVAPFLLYRFVRILLRKDRWDNSYLVFLIVLSFMMFLNLYFNFLITGNFFDAPNHYHHRWEHLGFQDDYTLVDALYFVIARFFFLMDWFPPAFIVLYLFSLFRPEKRNPDQLLFCYGFFYLVFAYLFYYSWGGNQYGPRYYLCGIPFLTFTLAVCIRDWWRKGTNEIKKFILGLLIVAAIGNFYSLQKNARYHEVVSSERKALYDTAEQNVKRPAIVFIIGFLGDRLVMSEEDAVRNPPNLDASILYAHDLGEKNKLLMNYYPERSYYRGFYDRSKKEARLEEIYA